MARVIHEKTEERLKLYFTGELEKKIYRIKKKIKEGFPDEYYCTLDSVTYVNARKDGNYISDPTGWRATKLADISRNRNNTYQYYYNLHKAINEILKDLNNNDIYLIKAHLGIIEDGITAAAKNINFSHRKAKERTERIIKLFDKKITRYLLKN